MPMSHLAESTARLLRCKPQSQRLLHQTLSYLGTPGCRRAVAWDRGVEQLMGTAFTAAMDWLACASKAARGSTPVDCTVEALGNPIHTSSCLHTRQDITHSGMRKDLLDCSCIKFYVTYVHSSMTCISSLHVFRLHQELRACLCDLC
jgi:hypothetical protein